MNAMNTQSRLGQALKGATLALGSLVALSTHAATPGITGPSFNLTAAATKISQPNGRGVYAWGYGCNGTPSGFAPSAIGGTFCNSAQLPGPTLIVTEGDTVQVVLTNNLPPAAGATSILFPGFQVATSNGTAGLLTQEAPSLKSCNTGGTTPNCNTVTYTFVAAAPGTHSYYSGTQGDLQVEMGLYGALIVRPKPQNVPIQCKSGIHLQNLLAQGMNSQAHPGTVENDFTLAKAAYNHPSACYDREYLFQFSEMDDNIHVQAEQQVAADGGNCTNATGCLTIATEPYSPGYFLVNGRSMPDDMDPNYASMYPAQPYNGNPHMHPGELTLLRIIGQGRWQHPFHEHGNHVRVLARDGNIILSPPHIDSTGMTSTLPAGPLMFTTTTTPGMTMDGIFYWTGKGLNWDVFGHGTKDGKPVSTLADGRTPTPCVPDSNGYFTSVATAPNYFEWCGDHNKALEKNPSGQVAAGGPVTLPDPGIVTNGAWYGGSPYLGAEAMGRAVGITPIPPAGTVANSPTGEAGFAFMWHSHNEREITTDNVFPGGMMMMMLVDPRSYVIDESN